MNRLLIAYVCSAAISTILGIAAWYVPSLTQPILAMTLLKYVSIYLLAINVIENQRGYAWLIVMAVFEIATGMLTFFATYKEAIFVILIAFASSRRKLNMPLLLFSVTSVAVIFYISIVWTVVKGDYRPIMSTMTVGEKIDYMAGQYFSGNIDYQHGMLALFRRVGYTTLYSQVLARQDAGAIGSDYDFYENAMIHVLTPRVLFPNKAALDDSAITTDLLGMHIAANTSIGVGYVTEAQVDFGFPGLLVPLWTIGLMLGMAAEHLMTRSAPLHIRQAFTVAASFHCFWFETDIDKSLGGFITGFLVMVVALKFGYPVIAPWLTGVRLGNRGYIAQPTQ